VLVEAFCDDQAAVAHVGSAHFRQATHSLPDYLQETPKIVNMKIPQDDWSLLGAMTVPERT
jgi:quinol monooxygenase YgiN